MAQLLIPDPTAVQAQLRSITATQQQVTRARRIVTPGLVVNAARLAAAYPHIDAGQVVGLSLAQQEPGSATAEAVSERQIMQTQQSAISTSGEGWFDNFVYDPFKGLIRGAFTVFNAGIEELESLAVRTPIGAFQGVGNAAAQAGRSDAFYALSAAMRGEDVNLGEGFMPNSTITEDVQLLLSQGHSLADAMAKSEEQRALGTPITEQGRADRERLQITSNNGTSVPISFGRALAINVSEPGTRSFQYLSGFADLSKQIILDPADLLLGGAGKVGKLSRLVGNAEEASGLVKAARSAMLGNNSRKTFFGTSWEDYLASAQGSHFVGRINDAVGDEGFREIHDLYKSAGNTVNPDDITALTKSTNLQETGQLVKQLANDAGGDFKKFGRVGIGAMESGSTVGRALQLGAGPVGKAGGGVTKTPLSVIRGAPAAAGAATFGALEGGAQTIGNVAAGTIGFKPSSTIRKMDDLHIPMMKLVKDASDTGLGFSIRQSSTGTFLGRLASSTSAKAINVFEKADALEQYSDYMRGLGLETADYNRLLRRAADMDTEWAEASAAGVEGFNAFTHWFGLLKETNDIWVKSMKESGQNVSDEALNSIGRMFDSHDANRAFWVDNAGRDMIFGGARVNILVDGEMVAMPSAFLFSQFMEQAIPLMDSGAVRSLQRRKWWGDNALRGKLSGMFGADDFEKIGTNAAVRAADFATSKLWKPSVLLRLAWPIRVIGEEQFRLSGAMLSGSFNHPMQFLTLMLTKDSKLLGRFARMNDDVLGRAFVDVANHDEAMSKSFSNVVGGRNSSRWESKAKTEMSQREAAEAHIQSINQILEDELSQIIAARVREASDSGQDFNVTMLREIKDEFWHGKYEHIRRNLGNDSGRFEEVASVQARSDGYVDTVFAHMVHQFGGDGNLLNYTDGNWRNFSGDIVEAKDVARQANMESYTKFTVGDEADGVIDAAVDAIVNTGAHGWVDDLTNDLMDIQRKTGKPLPPAQGEVDDFQNQLVDIYDGYKQGFADEAAVEAAIRTEVDKLAGHIGIGTETTGYRNKSVPQYGSSEFMPTEEVLGAQGPLRGSDARRVNQSIGEQKLDQNVDDWLMEAEMAQDIVMPPSKLEELQRLGPGEHRTYTTTDGPDVHNQSGVTAVYGEGGDIEGVMSWYRTDGNFSIGVMGAIDGDNVVIWNMMNDVIKQGDIKPDEFVSAFTGNKRFMDFMRDATAGAGARHGTDVLPDNVVTYEQLHKWIKDNPDSMKAIEDMVKTNKLEPYSEALATQSASGVGMGAMAMRNEVRIPDAVGGGRAPGPVNQAAREMPQHTEYFQMNTMGDPRMWELAATREITGDGFRWGDEAVGEASKKQFKDRVSYFDTPEWNSTMPGYMRRPIKDPSTKQVGIWDQAVGTLMDVLMSKPTNYLSRSPAFKQYYWNRLSKMYEQADDTLRDLIRLQAKEAGLADDALLNVGAPIRAVRRASGREVAMDETIRRFKVDRSEGAEIIFNSSDNADVMLREMDEIAKSYALEETKNLLYDMSNSHNWSEMYRNVMPFGEAWFEVMTTWGRLIKENPRNLRRMQQAYQGAQDSDPFRGVEADGEQGRGLFYRDPNTGEEVFSYPGSGIIADWMLGDASEAVSFTGRVAGLSLATQVMPGLGPMIQIPLSQMGWVDDPNNSVARDLLLPFGKSQVTLKDPISLASPFVPAWVEKAVSAVFGEEGQGDMQRLYANTSMDVYKTLLMQGWSDSTEEDMMKTMAEAQKIAKKVYVIKAMSSFAAPTGASELWEVKYGSDDADGDLWAYQNLATAYRQILNDSDGDDVVAYKKFTDLFGVDPLLFTTAKTQRVLPRAVTLEARRWEYDNVGLYDLDRFPNTAYYARPDGVDGEFDYEAYMLQLKDGTRQPLTLEQWAKRRNQMLGKVAYANFQRAADQRFRDADQKQQWLRQQQASLMSYFPGFGREIPGLPATADINTQIQELYRWSLEPALAESSVGGSLATYLTMRDSVIQRTKLIYGYKTDTGFRTGVNAAVYRAQLRQLGMKLSEENPDFVPVFSQILLRELQEPEAGQSPVNLAGVEF